MAEKPDTGNIDVAGIVARRRDRHAAIALVANVADLSDLVVIVIPEARENLRAEQEGVGDGRVVRERVVVAVLKENGERRVRVGVCADENEELDGFITRRVNNLRHICRVVGSSRYGRESTLNVDRVVQVFGSHRRLLLCKRENRRRRSAAIRR